MCHGLAAQYEELEQLDRELSRAQGDLLAAHLKLAGCTGQRPQTIYNEVLGLRARSRQLLTRLGDELVAGGQ